MQQNDVKKLGRVEYIEPNNLFYTSDGNKVQNGIPQPYEDYSFSVNLRVINGDRYDCGMTGDGGDISKNVIEFTSDNGTLSFMDGTSVGGQGYLTTNFTDINMNDPSTNTKECLGIESISIKYDSWYYPTVDIKFIDVRGASLMQPAEYEYYNTGGPNKEKEYRKANSDFFKAFFSFPYPLFKLSVKGFYGKEVTYDLSVLKCNVEFNSSTGNFEVNASFIGYMYGMYADLPFPFVYLAPYINLYGRNTWDEKRTTGDFCYVTTDKDNPIGKAMYTFPELKREVENAGQEADKEIQESDDGIKRAELESLIKKIQQEVIARYPITTKNYGWWSWSKNNTEEDKRGYFFIPLENSNENNRKVFEDMLKFTKALEEYNTLAQGTKNYKDKVIGTKDFFDSFSKDAKYVLSQKSSQTGNASAATVSAEYTDEDIKKILSGKIVSLAFHKDDSDKEKPVLVFDETKSDFGTASKSDYTDLVNELIRRFKEDQVKSPMQKKSKTKEWTIRAFYFQDISYKAGILKISDSLKKEHDELVKKLDRLRDLKIEKAIGFEPTIRNMYNMVFAHIDTFMSTFYNTLDRIRQSIQSSTDDTRKFENLCGGGVQCDVAENTLKSNSSNGGKLPPFTMFYKEETEKDGKEKKITMLWPGDLDGGKGKDLDEVKLVESIINATALNRKTYEPVTAQYNVIHREGDLAPISYYDIVRGPGNPYLDILNAKSLSDEKTVQEVLKVFVLRCFYAMLSGSYVAPDAETNKDGTSTSTANFTEKAKLVAELEVGNVERAFKMLKMVPTKAFLLGLNKLSTDGATLMGDFLKGNKPMFSSNAGNGDLSYTWMSRVYEGSELYKFLPVGTFENQTLANYAAGANLTKDVDKFLKINSAGTVVNGTYACHIYAGGNRLESSLTKYTSGDFSRAAKLFPNYDSVPASLSGLTEFYDTENGGLTSSMFEKYGNYNTETKEYEIDPVTAQLLKKNKHATTLLSPSTRRTDAGITSIFMDPLYYAQKSREARAYLFLMGVSFEKTGNFFLPDRVENGDYPTLLLLREGAYYWRNQGIYTMGDEGAPIVEFGDDPIVYEYTINGSTVNVLDDIERNDPCFGRRVALDFYKNPPKYSSVGRQQALMDYFLKWADNVAAGDNSDVVIPTVTATSYVHVDVPDTIMRFQEIESRLALWEINGTVKQLLNAESCASAVTAEFASSFANATHLKSLYNVGADDRLGKVNGKIRTDVYLMQSDNAPIDSVAFLTIFKKFYYGTDTILDFSCLDNPTAKVTVPRSAMNDAAAAFVSGLKDAYKISIDYLKEHTGADSAGAPEDSSEMPQYFKDKDLKLACYMALKNMYDRWLCSRRRESWYFSCIPERMNTNEIKSDFLRFFYIDEFYHDIGMRARPNLTNIINKISDLGGFTEKTKEENLASDSIMKVLSYTAQYASCALLALPTMLGLARTYTDENNSIAEVFKAYPYNEAVRNNSIESSFVILYSNQKSSKLDVKSDDGKNAYKTDGFDIANTWGEIVPQPMFSDDEEDGFVVPCFGVTFAKQNQSYFKDVRLSMEDHQVTDFSIRNEVMISYQNNKGPRETTIMGQDLYSVYSNYSYSCSVSMMGDAQITPLMYFQLNNIAMWKGAYLITNVHHDITARGMETVFTGVRQSRYSVPFKDDEMIMPGSDAAGQTPQSQDKTEPPQKEEDLNVSQRPLDLINVDDVESAVFVLDRTSLRTSNKIESAYTIVNETINKLEEWVNGLLAVRIYYKDKQDMIDVGQTIEATYGLEQTITNLGTKNGRIENFTPPEDNNVVFMIPSGRYSSLFTENPFTGEEYRDPNDSFYSFTDGKHITVSDMRLGFKRCEIITGETNYDKFEVGGFKDISLGGTAPIMLYPPVDPDMNKQLDRNEIRAAYREIFSFIKRMKEAKKPISLLINENKDIKNSKS